MSFLLLTLVIAAPARFLCQELTSSGRSVTRAKSPMISFWVALLEVCSHALIFLEKGAELESLGTWKNFSRCMNPIDCSCGSQNSSTRSANAAGFLYFEIKNGSV